MAGLIQAETENLVAYVLEQQARRDAEIRERLRRLAGLSEQQRKALRQQTEKLDR